MIENGWLEVSSQPFFHALLFGDILYSISISAAAANRNSTKTSKSTVISQNLCWTKDAI